MDGEALPDSLTLDQALRAAYLITQQYVALEREPDAGLVLYLQYLHSDPAVWDDWKDAVRQALSGGASGDRPSNH